MNESNMYQTATNLGLSQAVFLKDTEIAKQSPQEIPEQIDRILCALGESKAMLQALYQRLVAVLPVEKPEQTTGVGNATGPREPSSPLGLQLSNIAGELYAQHASMRRLLERIKL